MPLAKVSNKGQITLPAAERRRLGIVPNSTVEVVAGDREIIIRPRRSIMELAGVFQAYAKGKPTDWEQVRTEVERAVAEEVASE